MSDKRYAVLAEGCFDEDAKTATGVMRYAESPTVAVIDSTRAGTSASAHVPGLRSDVPVVADMDAAMQHGPTTLLVGVAPAAASSRPPSGAPSCGRSSSAWTSRAACTSS